MKKELKKWALKDANVLSDSDKKGIRGGSGSSGSGGSGVTGDYNLCGGSGYTHVCECKGQTAVWCGHYSDGGENAILTHCGPGTNAGDCRPFRK